MKPAFGLIYQKDDGWTRYIAVSCASCSYWHLELGYCDKLAIGNIAATFGCNEWEQNGDNWADFHINIDDHTRSERVKIERTRNEFQTSE